MGSEDTIHASVARIGERGILIRGPSGSGKSSLLLSLIMSEPAAVLIADDRTVLEVRDNRVIASAPAILAGQMEIRGIGIVRRPYAISAVVDLIVDLVPLADCPRLPSVDERSVLLAGISVPRIFIAAGASDGAVRVRAALAMETVGDSS